MQRNNANNGRRSCFFSERSISHFSHPASFSGLEKSNRGIIRGQEAYQDEGKRTDTWILPRIPRQFTI
jgi:hypothetical protein